MPRTKDEVIALGTELRPVDVRREPCGGSVRRRTLRAVADLMEEGRVRGFRLDGQLYFFAVEGE